MNLTPPCRILPLSTPRRHRPAALSVAAVALLLGVGTTPRAVRAESSLITQSEAQRVGLTRAWFAQVPLDSTRSRVTNWHLYRDRLYSVTDSGIVTALDSETGAQLWTKRLGRPGVTALGPSANEKYLAIISGSKLYLLDRDTGRLRWSHSLGSAPSAGPALTREYAYVALLTGRIEAYRLDDPDLQPWYYQSKGRTHLRPTATGNIVSWPTSIGYLYVCRADDPEVLFRLESNDDIVTSPAELEPFLYIASLDGNLYCLNETTGREQWRYTAGYPVESSPAIVGDHAYVASLEPVLHAIDAATGLPLWKAPGVSHFGAQGKERVYASDRYGNLLILDLKTGQQLGRIRTGHDSHTLVNDQTDRLFLVNDRGLVQSFHEIGVDTPTMYRKPPAVEAEAEAEAPNETATERTEPTAEEPADAPESDVEESPFGPPAGDDDAAADDAEPVEEAPMDDEPAAGADEDDNPFNDA